MMYCVFYTTERQGGVTGVLEEVLIYLGSSM